MMMSYSGWGALLDRIIRNVFPEETFEQRAWWRNKKCEDLKWMHFQQKCVLHQAFPINCKSSPQQVVAFVNAQLYFCTVYTFTYFFLQQIFIKLLQCGNHWIYNGLQKHTPFFFMELLWGWLSLVLNMQIEYITTNRNDVSPPGLG